MGMGNGHYTGVQGQDVVYSVEQSAGILWGAGTRLLQGSVDQLHQLTHRRAVKDRDALYLGQNTK